MKKLLTFFIFLLVLGLAASFWAYQQVQKFVHQPVHSKPDQLLTVERGTTGKKLANLLEKEQLLDDAFLLPYVLRLQPERNKIKAGTYSMNGVKTVAELLTVLNEGKEAQFSLQFIEGDNFNAWRKNLENAPHLVQTLKGKSEADIFALLDLPDDVKAIHEWKKVEGWLYPDTYHYTPNSTDLALLKRAVERMKKVLAQAWEKRDPDLPLNNAYEMLILASIVEKETAIEAERGKVASVFLNRLKRNMRLQTDPTVIYGMGEKYQGNIRKKDLETPTAYNTYTIDGLPPTPIAMPSESAILAVAHPEKTAYLYFVADGTGGHKFTQTLAEHQRAVQQYLHWYRHQKNGK
ncbi:endolytic transglycosylase MltG [Pasteurella sp. PK-2025]|uniref:endolytic transglycosylase MltG n=1 Tax=unclassified Pasteurella TaxID=2621516 RepID=UPI003C732AC8